MNCLLWFTAEAEKISLGTSSWLVSRVTHEKGDFHWHVIINLFLIGWIKLTEACLPLLCLVASGG